MADGMANGRATLARTNTEEAPRVEAFRAPIGEFVLRARAQRAVLRLEPGLAFLVSRNGEELSFDLLHTGHEPQQEWGDSSTVSEPIALNGTHYGTLSLNFGHQASVPAGVADELRRMVARCLRQVDEPLADVVASKPQALLGQSAPSAARAVGGGGMRGALEHLVSRAATSDVPVLLLGEPGTEMRQVAKAIHQASRTVEAPWVTVHCGVTEPQGYLEEIDRRFHQAQNGTLYLDSVNQLSPKAQGRLYLCLVESNGGGALPPRLIASTQEDLHELCHQGRFSRRLLSALDYLTFRLPPLRERGEEIFRLFEESFRKYSSGKPCVLSLEVKLLFTRYPWPGNLEELDRVAARLAIWCDEGPITRDDLERTAAWLAAPIEPPRLPSPPPRMPVEDCESRHSELRMKRAQPCTPQAVAQLIVQGEFDFLESAHEGVQRAIEYLSDHFRDAVDMTTLARNAHVSPSHLSALFKLTLKMSFKTLLVHLRIEQAKLELGAPSSVRVTDVALEVGFNDVGHFAKVFRKIVGQTPREFRREQLSRREASKTPLPSREAYLG